MGKKRDIDRLAGLLLRFNAIEVTKMSMDCKEILDDKTASPKKKEKALQDAFERNLYTMQVIGSIMSKAESVETFGFDQEDAENMSIDDIRRKMGLLEDEPEEVLPKEIREITELIQQKLGGKVKVAPIELSKEKSEELRDLLNKIAAK